MPNENIKTYLLEISGFSEADYDHEQEVISEYTANMNQLSMAAMALSSTQFGPGQLYAQQTAQLQTQAFGAASQIYYDKVFEKVESIQAIVGDTEQNPFQTAAGTSLGKVYFTWKVGDLTTQFTYQGETLNNTLLSVFERAEANQMDPRRPGYVQSIQNQRSQELQEQLVAYASPEELFNPVPLPPEASRDDLTAPQRAVLRQKLEAREAANKIIDERNREIILGNYERRKVAEGIEFFGNNQDLFMQAKKMARATIRVMRPKQGKAKDAFERYSTPGSLVQVDSLDEHFDILWESNEFLIHNITITHRDRVRVFDTFDESFVEVMGKGAEIYQYTGTLMNTKNFAWKNKWSRGYQEWLRPTKMAENKAFCQLLVDDEIHEGVVLGTTIQIMSQTPHSVTFAFQMFVRERILLADDIEMYTSVEGTRVGLANIFGDDRARVVIRTDPADMSPIAIAEAKRRAFPSGEDIVTSGTFSLRL